MQVQELVPGDHNLRVEFANKMLQAMNTDQDFLNNLVFTDEAHFNIVGDVNKQNVRFWSNENPNVVQEQPLHQPRVTVWAGISMHGLIGPFFWNLDPKFPNEKGITSRWIVALYEEQVFPVIRRYRDRHKIIFQ